MQNNTQQSKNIAKQAGSVLGQAQLKLELELFFYLIQDLLHEIDFKLVNLDLVW